MLILKLVLDLYKRKALYVICKKKCLHSKKKLIKDKKASCCDINTWSTGGFVNYI